MGRLDTTDRYSDDNRSRSTLLRMYENQRHELTGEVIAVYILAKYMNGNTRTLMVNITYARGRDLDQQCERTKMTENLLEDLEPLCLAIPSSHRLVHVDDLW